jgi:hypothetical protein
MMKWKTGMFASPKELKDRYRNLINSLLLASTFAGTVTLSIILTPGNNNTTIPGIVELAYAGSLFLGGIMGCILITMSLELEITEFVVVIETIIVFAILYVAFYLLLFASTFFLSYRGPFILGSILYFGCGILMVVFFAKSLDWGDES